MGDVAQMPPPVVDFNADNVPDELKRIPRWVCWRYESRAGKPTKPPFQPDGSKARVDDPSTWYTFEDCAAALETGKFHGLGIIMSEADDIIAWDLDKCLEPSSLKVEKWADAIIRRLSSYTEITPSGRGFRIFVRGRLPVSGGKGKKNKQVECYQDRRFVTVTGSLWPGMPTAFSAHDDKLWRSLFEDQPDEIKRRSKDEKFQLLWAGDFATAGYASQSEADLAFCRMLADQCDGLADRIDSLFRRSGLYREKWDEDHSGGRGTYGALTIAKSLEGWSKRLHLTDLGNAIRLANLVSDTARHAQGDWFVWNGKFLERDETGLIYREAMKIPRLLDQEATDIKDEDLAEKLQSFARKTESRASLQNMIHLAGVQAGIAIKKGELDTRAHLINFDNGTLDLNSGDFREHRFADMLTRAVPYEFRPDADCPTWRRFLTEAMDGDESMVGYLQRLVGYSMTGFTREQKFFFLYGTGRNGKSTFWNAIMRLLGEYGTMLPRDAIIESRNEIHPTSLVGLFGARLALCNEWPQGKRINEDVVKQITGDDVMTARRMYQESFRFESTAKLWVIGNHKPQVRGTDLGIWRRVQLVPFTVTIDPAREDKTLKDRIQAEEMVGIARWAVEGVRMWLQDGLNPPQRVLSWTDEYRSEQDVLGRFLEEECGFSKEAYVYHGELYEKYTRTMERNREFVLKNREFAQQMRDKGFRDVRGTGNKMKWTGLFLRDGGEQKEMM